MLECFLFHHTNFTYSRMINKKCIGLGLSVQSISFRRGLNNVICWNWGDSPAFQNAAFVGIKRFTFQYFLRLKAVDFFNELAKSCEKDVITLSLLAVYTRESRCVRVCGVHARIQFWWCTQKRGKRWREPSFYTSFHTFIGVLRRYTSLIIPTEKASSRFLYENYLVVFTKFAVSRLSYMRRSEFGGVRRNWQVMRAGWIVDAWGCFLLVRR